MFYHLTLMKHQAHCGGCQISGLCQCERTKPA